MESLLLRIGRPSGNRVAGKFSKAENLIRRFKADIQRKQKLQLGELFNNIYPSWNKSKWAKLLQQTWSKRNERIANNVKKVFSTNPSLKRLVVFIGAAHIPSLKKNLQRNDSIVVKVLSDYELLIKK